MQNFSGKVVGAVFGVANPKEAHVCLKLSIENEQSLKAESVFLSMNQIVQYRESLWGKDLDESDIPGMFLGANVVLDVQQEHTNLIKINDVQMCAGIYDSYTTHTVKSSAIITSLSYSLFGLDKFYINIQLSIEPSPNEIIHAKIGCRMNVKAFTQAVETLGRQEFAVNAKTSPVKCTICTQQNEGGSLSVSIFMKEEGNQQLLLTVPANSFKQIDN